MESGQKRIREMLEISEDINRERGSPLVRIIYS